MIKLKRDTSDTVSTAKEADISQTSLQNIVKFLLRTVKGVKVKVILKDNVKPVFIKARPIPYALRPAVEAELDQLSKWYLTLNTDKGLYKQNRLLFAIVSIPAIQQRHNGPDIPKTECIIDMIIIGTNDEEHN